MGTIRSLIECGRKIQKKETPKEAPKEAQNNKIANIAGSV